MAVTETVRESWISRLGNSIKGMLVGLAFFIIGSPVLFSNEGRSVATAKALNEGEGACVPLPSVAAVDPAFEGKLVHATGLADTDETLDDPEFGVSAVAIMLRRKVEMYQWHEESHASEKKNLGGSVTRTTTYTYSKGWNEDLVDSSDFKEAGHDNPPVMGYESLEKLTARARLGAYRLNATTQTPRIGGNAPFRLPADYACPVEKAQRLGDVLYIPAVAPDTKDGSGREVASAPQIGDLRVSFEVIMPHEISIVAKQMGDTFVPYTAKSGKSVNLLQNGVVDAQAMFASARRGNAMTTWFLRLVGFLLMYFGLSMVLRPLSVIGDVVPFIGTIIGIGAGIVAGTVALACALVTIAVAWLFFRPVIGVLLLAAAAFLLWRLWSKRRGAKA